MAGEQIFAGDWTEEKLERVKKYLPACTTIIKKYFKEFFYIDAFAGTGYREAETKDSNEYLNDLDEKEIEKYADGSARVALQIKPDFSRYIFIEKVKPRFNKLEKLKTDFPEKANRIILVNDEAYIYLRKFCRESDWTQTRAVMFLDPYGMQVSWDTLKTIAETKAIDLWYLFPLGVAVNRLLKKEKKEIPEAWAKKLDDIFGTDQWRETFYKKKIERTLFGSMDSIVKDTDFDGIIDFFLERLRSIFVGVAENPLLLRNSKNNPLYLLCFAASNNKGATTAIKIAQHILKN